MHFFLIEKNETSHFTGMGFPDPVVISSLNRCGGTVGAIFTCPLEVIKTRLQSSRLALRTVYYPQVHLGTISGAGVVRPTSVTPGLFQVLK